jgi:DNA-binding transcriptional regulator YhcF (GntR family)
MFVKQFLDVSLLRCRTVLRPALPSLTRHDTTHTIFRMKKVETQSDHLKASPGKLYEQVAALIQKRIQSGAWVKGERLPSIEALAKSFDVAVVTVRQALKLLEEKGLIDRHQGRGTFVAIDAQEKRWLKLESNWEALIKMWGRSRPKSLKVTDVSAPPPATDTCAEYIPLTAFRTPSATSTWTEGSMQGARPALIPRW